MLQTYRLHTNTVMDEFVQCESTTFAHFYYTIEQYLGKSTDIKTNNEFKETVNYVSDIGVCLYDFLSAKSSLQYFCITQPKGTR